MNEASLKLAFPWRRRVPPAPAPMIDTAAETVAQAKALAEAIARAELDLDVLLTRVEEAKK